MTPTQSVPAASSSHCTDVIDCPSACAAGDSAACLLLADSLDAASPASGALVAASAYARACESGDRRACSRARALLDDESDAPLARAVAERSAQTLAHLCDGGDDPACGEALALAETWSLTGVGRRVLERMQRRCDRGAASACLEILAAGQVAQGTTPQLEQRIINLGRAQCLSGAETACLTMKSFAELRRREDAADEAERKLRLATSAMRQQIEALAKRCAGAAASDEQGDRDACIDLATLYMLNGMPVTARYTMGRACNLDRPDGVLCWNAFLLQRDFSTAGIELAQLEPWQKLDAACRARAERACVLVAFAARLGAAEIISPALAEAAAEGEQHPFGVTAVTTLPGGGAPSLEGDRVLALVSWHASNGDPLARSTSLELISLDRGDALAEVLRGRTVGERVLARISPGPLSLFAIPVLAAVELLAFVPRGPQRN